LLPGAGGGEQLGNEPAVGKPPPKKADQPKINKIAVDRRGQITFNSEVVTVAQLKNTL